MAGGFFGRHWRFEDFDIGDLFEGDFFGFSGFMAGDGGGGGGGGGGGMVAEVVEITISSLFCGGDDGGREFVGDCLFGGGGGSESGNGSGSESGSGGSVAAGRGVA